jgi:hypothetical protein
MSENKETDKIKDKSFKNDLKKKIREQMEFCYEKIF